MRRNQYLLFIILCLITITSCNFPKFENQLQNLDKVKHQVSIKNWRIFGPFAFNQIHKNGDSIATFKSDYAFFKHYYFGQSALVSPSPFTEYTQTGDYVDLNSALKINNAHSAFAFCEINSAEDQNVTFSMGIANNATLWVNDRLKLDTSATKFSRNAYTANVHLQEGRNLIVVGLSSDKEALGFNLDVSPASEIKL